MTSVLQLLQALDKGNFKLVRRIGYYEVIQYNKVVFTCKELTK